MSRTSLRAAVYVSVALQGLLGGTLGVHASSSRCRCLSTEPCWPSADEFSKLEAQLSQPLLKPVPPASPCYPADAPSAECAVVQQSWINGTWRADQPGSMQAPNWENYIFSNGTISACYLDTTLGVPCEQGSIPVLGVDARWPEDIQAAVKFATAHNLRIVVKNTGHDYLGRSTARGSFLIWTHYMKNITFHDTFVPEGSPEPIVYHNIITLGAGVQWHEAYTAVHARGRELAGGVSLGGSVGAAGGWIQGGGHGVLSPKYGLGVDNVIQITVVTANGKHLTTNAHQNPNLFWALRGGGGGTFGIVTSVTYKTHPSTPIISAVFSAYINTTSSTANVSTTGTSAVLEELFTEFVRMTPAMLDNGWAGYAAIVPTAPTNVPSLQFAYIAPNVSWEDANSTMIPFFRFAQELAAKSSVDTIGSLNIVSAHTFPLDSFATWYTMYLENAVGEVGTEAELTSRLLSRANIKDYTSVAATLLSMVSADGEVFYFAVGGGAVTDVDPYAAGINPAWRKTLVHVLAGVGWAEGASSVVIEQQRSKLKRFSDALHELAPLSGAYLNEASLYENNPQYTFFGTHYAELKTIKSKYDPADLFIVAKGVGSEEWDESLHCHL